MKSIVGLILSGGYLLLVAALLVCRVLVIADFRLWQDVDSALFVLALPWSILSFFTIWIDKPFLTDLAFLAVHAIGGLFNATIIYFVCAIISYWVKKLDGPGQA